MMHNLLSLPWDRCHWHVIKSGACLNHVKQEKGLLEYNSAISPFGIHFTFFHNALAGRPTEKLIMRLKKELLVWPRRVKAERKRERERESSKRNKWRATTLSELETFNIKSVNKWNMPRVSDYHTEMHHLLFSKKHWSKHDSQHSLDLMIISMKHFTPQKSEQFCPKNLIWLV